MSQTLGQNFFELPETSIRGIPFLDSLNNKLELGLVEVGCKPRNKKRDLSDKRQLIYKWWSDNYKKKGIVNWLPKVYRTLIHYYPGMDPSLYGRRTQLDVVILYTEISQEMLSNLTDEEKAKIYARMGKEEKLKKRPDLLGANKGGTPAEIQKTLKAYVDNFIKKTDKNIVTDVIQKTIFYEAEDYHQHYLQKISDKSR